MTTMRAHTADMVFVKGGRFTMGSNDHYAEEAPAREVIVDDFWIDPRPVTNREFGRFVEETGHVTLAEQAPDPADYPGILPDMIRAGSLLFVPTSGPVDLSNPMQWWQFRFDANWRQPTGPGSSIAGMEDHPVVHVCYEDALAYAKWAGKALPTEAQWEFAARGGSDTEYAWGDELLPGGKALANFWQGEFPYENLELDGFARTSPVGAFPPNGYGLYDMVGNVWEWTGDWYREGDAAQPAKSCCIPRNPRGCSEEESFDERMPAIRIGRKVLKGGSHLCAPNYCQRYRPAARTPQTVDTSTSHIGFRCVANG